MNKKKHNILLLFCIAIFLLIFSGGIVSGAGVQLQVKIASSPPEMYTIRTVHVLEEPFVPLDEVAKVTKWHVTVQPTLHLLILSVGSDVLKVAGENPFLMINDHIFQMPIESRYHAGHVYVPVRYFFPILQEHFSGVVRYWDVERVIEVPPASGKMLDIPPQPAEPRAEKIVEPSPNLTRLTIEEKANGTLVRIQAGRMFRQEDFSSWLNDSGWLYVQIYGGLLGWNNRDIMPGKGFIERVVPVQQPQLAQISLKLNRMIESHEVGQDPRTKEILITLYKKMSATPTMDDAVSALLKQHQKKWQIDTITLDAGHGGKDPGAVGKYYKTREKDIVLDVTKRLGILIEARTNIKVVYTRKSDNFLTLRRRTQIANQAGSKLFISIHANAARSRKASGFETYILGPGKDKAAIAVAEKENNVVKIYEQSEKEYEGFLNGNKMIYSIMQSGFVKESEELAAQVARGMGQTLDMPNRGLKQAGFLVLWRASMPNILVEIGYLTNKSEERKLRSSKYRERVAEGIYRGIMAFVKETQQNMARSSQ